MSFSTRISIAISYLLDVQADLLDSLTTGVVVSLFTTKLAGVSNRSLGENVQSLNDQRNEIIAAIDLLFIGI